MFEAVFRCETIVCTRFVDRIQVLPLDVLDERDQERFAIGQRADDRGDRLEASLAGRQIAALTGDQLEAVRRRAEKDGLEHTSLADRVRELLDGRWIELGPWLRGVARDLRERD